MAPADWMLIGRIGGPFGVRGEMHVDPYTDFPERFATLRQIYLGPDHRAIQVEESRPHKRQFLLKLTGIETPEQVRALGHPEIFIPRSDLPPLPEGHFYLEEVVGMEVRTSEGETVGTIAEVLRTGSNEVFVVRNKGREILIPVIKGAIEKLDLQGRTVTVERWALGPEE